MDVVLVFGTGLVAMFVLALVSARSRDVAEAAEGPPRPYTEWSIVAWLTAVLGVFLVSLAVGAEQTEGWALVGLIAGSGFVLAALVLATAIAPWRSSVERLMWGIVLWFASLVPGWFAATAAMFALFDPCRDISTTWEGVGCAWGWGLLMLGPAAAFSSIAVVAWVMWTKSRRNKVHDRQH